MKFFAKNPMPVYMASDGEWRHFPTYLAENWTYIAAFAWETYLKVGRGAVRFNEERIWGYISAASPDLITARNLSDVRANCARYQPEREIVIMGASAQDENALHAGKIKWFCAVVGPPQVGMLTPPEAYAERVRGVAHDVASLRAAQRQEGRRR